MTAVLSTTTTSVTDRITVLCATASFAVGRGDWPGVQEVANEAMGLAHGTTDPRLVAEIEAVAGIAAAVRGDLPLARARLGRSERVAIDHGVPDLLDVVALGRGVEAVSGGRYAEAWPRLRQLVAAERADGWIRVAAAGFLAEVGLRCGDEVAPGAVLEAVRGIAPAAAPPSVHGATAFARAVGLHLVTGEVTFEAALDECPPERAFDRARLNLALGVCLRRERRVVEARLPLHEALAGFERLGAEPWADQARGELRASGARRARRDTGCREALTEQELLIVRLAAQGMTNREIGQRLYLSHRTIGSHLYRAFPKLGIAARSQLRDVLDELSDQETARLRTVR